MTKEDAGWRPAPRPVAAVRSLEVVEPEPGLQVGVDRRGARVVAIPEGDTIVEVEDGPLEALDEGVGARSLVVAAVARTRA